tara:strand:+ start:448 stop:648 length:201 start_codon:yes stop_codon:yes gene_type:complete
MLASLHADHAVYPNVGLWVRSPSSMARVYIPTAAPDATRSELKKGLAAIVEDEPPVHIILMAEKPK